eukprot:6572735-Prorocentrum_lima.AAC.1
MNVMERHNAELTRRVEDMRMQLRVLMAEKESAGPLVGEMTGLQRGLQMLRRYFGMTGDNMASELS